LNILFSTAVQAFTPSFIGRSELVAANTRMQISSSLAQSGGPGLAGILVQRLSAPAALSVDAASFLLCALLIFWIKLPDTPSSSGRRRALASEILEGINWLVRNPILRALVLNVANFSLAFNMVSAIYVLYLTRELDLSPAVLGVIVAMRGVGSVVGSIAVLGWAGKLGTGRSLLSATGLGSAGLLLVPIADGPSAALMLAFGQFAFGIGMPLFSVYQTSLRMALTPDQLQGRVTASFRFFAQGPAPLGALLGGALGAALGLRPAILLGAVCAVIAIVWLVASPVRRLAALPTAAAPN
jgi:predicted MFS family arabinose efflux permease